MAIKTTNNNALKAAHDCSGLSGAIKVKRKNLVEVIKDNQSQLVWTHNRTSSRRRCEAEVSHHRL